MCRESFRLRSARCLLLLFLNGSLWLCFAAVILLAEGGGGGEGYKCSVKRVQRDFLDSLWNETRTLGESDWKSVARRRLARFEDELRESFLSSSSSSTSSSSSLSLPSASILAFSLASAAGIREGHLPSTSAGKAVAASFVLLAVPSFSLLVSELAAAITSLATGKRRTDSGGIFGKGLGLLSAAAAAAGQDNEEEARQRARSMLQQRLTGGAAAAAALLLLYLAAGSTILTAATSSSAKTGGVWSNFFPDNFLFSLGASARTSLGRVGPQEPLIFFLFQFWFLLGGLALFLIYSRALQKLISSLLDSFFDTLRGVRGGGKRSEKTKCD